MSKVLLFAFAVLLNYCKNSCAGCSEPNGTCIIDINLCQCNFHMTTYPRNSTEQCNYQRKQQWISFVLETVVAFGAGHFYAGNYGKAVPKLIVWIIGWTLFALMRIMSVKREIEDPLALVYALWSFIFCLVILIWYVTDVVMIGLNRYDDGNGVEMIYW